MSTTTLDPAPVPAHQPKAGTGRLTPLRLVNAEWIKFRTLRSSWYTLFAGVLALIVLAGVLGYNTGKGFAGMKPDDLVPSGVLQGSAMTQLLVAVLGVLFVTGEYGTGMIRSTMTAVPKRVPVLIAKAVVFATVTLVTMVAASLAAFLLGQAFLHHHGRGAALGDTGVLRVVIGTGVYLTLVGVFASGVGWIVRSTAGGISAALALLLVLPTLLGLVSSAKPLVRFLPSKAGSSFISSLQHPGHPQPLDRTRGPRRLDAHGPRHRGPDAAPTRRLARNRAAGMNQLRRLWLCRGPLDPETRTQLATAPTPPPPPAKNVPAGQSPYGDRIVRSRGAAGCQTGHIALSEPRHSPLQVTAPPLRAGREPSHCQGTETPLNRGVPRPVLVRTTTVVRGHPRPSAREAPSLSSSRLLDG